MKVKLALYMLVDKEGVVPGRKFPTPELFSESPTIDIKKGSLDLQNWLFQINGVIRPWQVTIDHCNRNKNKVTKDE